MRPANQLKYEHTTEPVFLSINDLAKRWGVCRQTINNAISKKTLIAVRIGTRVLIPVTDIERVERELQGGGKR